MKALIIAIMVASNTQKEVGMLFWPNHSQRLNAKCKKMVSHKQILWVAWYSLASRLADGNGG